MRTTTTQLTKPQANWVGEVTEQKHEAINPETKEKVSIDFSKDLYSLLETLVPHKVLKDYFQIDEEVADGYVKHKLTDYVKVKQHYLAIERFLRELTHTRLYQHLQSLNNPEKALEILLDMFSPPPQKPKGQGGQSDSNGEQEGEQPEGQKQQGEGEQQEGQGQEGESDQQEGQGQSGNAQQNESDQPEEEQGEGKGKEDKEEQDEQQSSQSSQGSNSGKDSQSQSQNEQGQDDKQKPKKEKKEEMDTAPEEEMSDAPPPPLLDIEKFKNDIPSIEETLKNNVFDDEVIRRVLEQQSGSAHNSLTTIEGLAQNIDKLSQFLTEDKFRILDVARKVGATEQYAREENLSDVNYPEKDWRVTNMKTMSDLPEVLLYQFLYPEAVFDKMLMDKDLKIKQYESRRKKKQVLYLLIDGSGSMDRRKQITACGIAIAYIRKAIQEGSIYFFRFFDNSVFDLHTVTSETEAVEAIDYLLNNPQSNGGTCIDTALQKAVQDINDPKLFKQDPDDDSDLYERADILVITDGEDDVRTTKEFLEENKVVLHSFLLYQQNKNLEEISKTYQYLSTKQMSSLIN